VRNRRRVVYYAILLLLILGELLGEINYIIIIFPEYDKPPWYYLLNHQYLGNHHDLSFGSKLSRSPLHIAQNEFKTTSRQLILVEI